MTADPGRSNLLGKTIDTLLWVQRRTIPFRRQEMATELEISPSCALRYLHCLETRDIVSSDRSHTEWTWMTTPIAEAK